MKKKSSKSNLIGAFALVAEARVDGVHAAQDLLERPVHAVHLAQLRVDGRQRHLEQAVHKKKRALG